MQMRAGQMLIVLQTLLAIGFFILAAAATLATPALPAPQSTTVLSTTAGVHKPAFTLAQGPAIALAHHQATLSHQMAARAS